MGNYIKGTFSVAAALSTMLTLGMGGIAFADTSEPEPSQECTAATQALTEGEATIRAAANLTVTQGELERLQAIPEGDKYYEVAQEKIAKIQAALGVDIAALTSDKESACASTDEPTTTPEPGEGEQPPAGNDGGDDAAVDIQAQVDAAINEIRGFECDTTVGALEASGIFTDAYLQITTDLPLGVTSAQLGAISDAYLDRVAELNYCVGDGVTPPADVVDEATNGGTINAGSNNVTGGSNSQFESMPTVAPETGLL